MRPNGLVLVDKDSGMTSHDVVARLRAIVGERRIGHAGTLDPMATGLLVLAVGPATRLLRFATAQTKRYSGVVRFGEATDSLDADGTVVARVDVPDLDATIVAAAAATLCGDIDQVPPMVSAIKVAGRRLYAIAREGGEVERAPRRVRVDDFTLSPTVEPTDWSFTVTCSPGTYVRVLAADLAERLGTLGHLRALRRDASGGLEVTEALSLASIASAVSAGDEVLRPALDLVGSLRRYVVDDERIVAIRHGQRVDVPDATGEEVAAIDARGTLVAVLRRRGENYQPDVVMSSSG